MSLKIRIFLIVLNLIKCTQGALLYPQFTVMQLIGSVSVPVTDVPKDRKIFFDWGLQMNYDMPYNLSSFYMAPIWPTNRSRSLLISSRAVHKNDFTADDFYQGLENMLERYGFDRSCLKQSICELSQNPFDESFQNMLSDVISFFLRPSVHQGFSADEISYSLAENQAFLGKECQELYPQCVDNLLNILTKS